MENYERTISLKTIWLTLVRRYDGILFIFLPILLASFLVTNFMITKTYQSRVAITNTAVFNQNSYNNLTNVAKKAETLQTVSQNLAGEKKISITVTDLSKGLSFSSYSSTSSVVTFYFQASNQKITKYVLDEIAKVTLAAAAEAPYSLTNLTRSNATEGTKNSSETKYFLIATAAGLVVALAVPFIYEIFADEVYDAKDVSAWGVPATLIDASKGVVVAKKPE